MVIPLIDLDAQYKTIGKEIEEAIKRVFSTNQFILGQEGEKLEKEIASFINVKYACGVASGTDALILALEALGIGQGDEVITTPFTFFATSEAICRVGAKPVFVDIEPSTLNINPELIEKKVTERSKAIIPVHLFGHPAEMKSVFILARQFNLKIIEDACQAIGAEYKGQKVGFLGNVACFSFFPSKNLGGAGDGGMVVTNNELIYQKIKILRNHGSSEKYSHKLIGYNSRLDELQAAILRVKLKKLKKWNEQRRKNANYYSVLLNNTEIITPVEAEYAKHVYHLYVIRTRKREKIIKALQKKNIAYGIYYPLPLHLQAAHKDLGYREGDFPVAEEISREVLALPMYPELTKSEIEEVVITIREAIGK